jgi:hypothetical protein
VSKPLCWRGRTTAGELGLTDILLEVVVESLKLEVGDLAQVEHGLECVEHAR